MPLQKGISYTLFLCKESRYRYMIYISKLQSQHVNTSIVDKAKISVSELCSHHLPGRSIYLKVTTQILRVAETKVLHLQHHFKEAHSIGILLLSYTLILPQTIAETGRAVPLILKCNPFARHETSQELSTNHFGWVFQTGISLHKLNGAERAGITPQLPLKQVTLKMKEVSIQVMPNHSWHIAHIQESHHYCHVDIKFTLTGTYATCLAKAQHASWEHLLSSPQPAHDSLWAAQVQRSSLWSPPGTGWDINSPTHHVTVFLRVSETLL